MQIRKGLTLDDIDIRERERAFIAGGVGSGKSTLADYLRGAFVQRYHARGGRAILLDSKPRYRAQYDAYGRSVKNRYRKWSHGEFIPGSVVVDQPDDLKLAWQTGARVVIVQCESRNEYPRLVATARKFLQDSRANRPQLAQVDETLDFFHSNGSPIGGDDTIVQLARAGRERGTAVAYCSQRTKGIPPTLMGELTKLYALRIDYVADAKRFQEMGAPPIPKLTVPHEFYYWTKDDYPTIYGPLILDMKGKK